MLLYQSIFRISSPSKNNFKVIKIQNYKVNNTVFKNQMKENKIIQNYNINNNCNKHIICRCLNHKGHKLENNRHTKFHLIYYIINKIKIINKCLHLVGENWEIIIIIQKLIDNKKEVIIILVQLIEELIQVRWHPHQQIIII